MNSSPHSTLQYLSQYQRLQSIAVQVGDLVIGNKHPIRIQTMTTTDTLNTLATVEQSIRCIEAGAELIRITAPSKKEAENLYHIKKELRKRGYHTPLIADIHYTPNAAEIAAQIVEKVRINPGNYIDKKKSTRQDYIDREYEIEIEKIRERFLPLLRICKSNATAMRIGTNHGSLSDRILSRYGDTPIGMVESAMEFLRIALAENYRQIILSMKASNPLVMVHAYRVLVQKMQEEFGFCFPLHLGVTEAGDGEDGRIKSAIGIGTLLEDGIGDTIRVSLTEDPEFEIPVCQDLVSRYQHKHTTENIAPITSIAYDHCQYNRNKTKSVMNVGEKQVPIVMADLQLVEKIDLQHLQDIGYFYKSTDDKWNIKDNAADYVVLQKKAPIELPKSLKAVVPIQEWSERDDHYFPVFTWEEWQQKTNCSEALNFIQINISENENWETIFSTLKQENNIVYLVETSPLASYHLRRAWAIQKQNCNDQTPFVWKLNTLQGEHNHIDKQLIHFASELGALLLDGFGDGLFLSAQEDIPNVKAKGRTYLKMSRLSQFLNECAFSILQATRTRISKTEYISCPSCGRTLFDLQSTTTKIRKATQHLKGVKIAVMGCIVNGPGEMADADFGYVGSGVDKVHLYKAKEIVKKNIDASVAVEELIQLIKDNNRWND